MAAWKRIPSPIADEQDRRTLCGILTAYGMEVRIVKERAAQRGTVSRYVEYRDTGLLTPREVWKETHA